MTGLVMGKKSDLNEREEVAAELIRVGGIAQEAYDRAHSLMTSEQSDYLTGQNVPTGANPDDYVFSGTYAMYVPSNVPVGCGGRTMLEVNSSRTGEYVEQTITSISAGAKNRAYRAGMPDGAGGVSFDDWVSVMTTENTIVDANGFVKAA